MTYRSRDTWSVFAKVALIALLGLASRNIAKADCYDICGQAYAGCVQSTGEDPNCLSCTCNCGACYCNVGCGVDMDCSGNGCGS